MMNSSLSIFFLKIDFVLEISAQLLGDFGCYRHEWVNDLIRRDQAGTVAPYFFISPTYATDDQSMAKGCGGGLPDICVLSNLNLFLPTSAIFNH